MPTNCLPSYSSIGASRDSWNAPRRDSAPGPGVLGDGVDRPLHGGVAGQAPANHHRQAVLALARRRLNVLWAMLRAEFGIPKRNRSSNHQVTYRAHGWAASSAWRSVT